MLGAHEIKTKAEEVSESPLAQTVSVPCRGVVSHSPTLLRTPPSAFYRKLKVLGGLEGCPERFGDSP